MSGLAIEIRPAQPADIAEITRIYAHYVLHSLATFEIDPPTDEEMARRYRTLAANGFPYFVALENDRVVGYAYAGPYRERIAYRYTVENSIYIDHARTGRGIGRPLLETLIGESERRGFRQMLAVIGDSANRASIRVHLRGGFTLTGTFRSVGFKHGRWVDTVLMQRMLGAGDQALP